MFRRDRSSSILFDWHKKLAFSVQKTINLNVFILKEMSCHSVQGSVIMISLSVLKFISSAPCSCAEPTSDGDKDKPWIINTSLEQIHNWDPHRLTCTTAHLLAPMWLKHAHHLECCDPSLLIKARQLMQSELSFGACINSLCNGPPAHK